MFKKNGLLYPSKEAYAVDNTIDRQLHRIRQKRISHNIDRATRRYIQREKQRGCLKWNP